MTTEHMNIIANVPFHLFLQLVFFMLPLTIFYKFIVKD